LQLVAKLLQTTDFSHSSHTYIGSGSWLLIWNRNISENNIIYISYLR